MRPADMSVRDFVEAALYGDSKAPRPVFELADLEGWALACPRWPGRTKELVAQAVAVALTGHTVTLVARDEATAERIMELARELATGSLVKWLKVEVDDGQE